MITFQTVIEEACKQKKLIADAFYDLLKEDQEEELYKSYNVITLFDGEPPYPIRFIVDSELENASYTEPNLKLVTLSTDDFDGVRLSRKQIITMFEKELKRFEEMLQI